MGIQSMTDCMFPADTRRQNFVFHSPWLLQDASQLTRISAWAFVAALHNDTWSLVTSSLSPPPLTFHPPVPILASWLLFHLEALLQLPGRVFPAPSTPSSSRPQPFLPHPAKPASSSLLGQAVGTSSSPALSAAVTAAARSLSLFLPCTFLRLGSLLQLPPATSGGKNQRSPCLQPWDADFLLRERPQRLPLTVAVPDTLAPRHTLHVHKNTPPGLCFLLQNSSSAPAAVPLRKHL